jgi:RND family efflux transporter MFP subunit
MNRILRSVAILLVLASAALWQAGCNKRPATSSQEVLPTIQVRIQTVETKPHVATEEVVGTVRAKLHAALEAKVIGRIETMRVAPGQSVKSGELLAQLDAREIQAQLDQALALREQAARDTERLRSLLAQNLVSRQEFETVESRYRVSAASATEAETMLGYTKIVAPFDGIVTRKLADVGHLAAPGRPLLELDDPQLLRLEADVPEALINRVQLGATLRVGAASENSDIAGVVSEIAPVADPASRTFNVRLDLPANAGLRAGQFARVAIPIGETRSLRVPAPSVVRRGQMELVFVVVNQQAQLRLVKTGKRIGDSVELVSGVSAGERIVVEGADRLRDGQPVDAK